MISFFKRKLRQKLGVSTKGQRPSEKVPYASVEISNMLDKNIDEMKQIFTYPDNKGFVIRKVRIPALNAQATILFLDEMINTDILEQRVLRPLMQSQNRSEGDPADFLIENVIETKDVKKITSFHETIDDIVEGQCLLFVDGYNWALSINTVGFEHRSVGKALNENILKGPHEGFVESSQTNKSLIRKYLRDPNLVVESITVGQRTHNAIYVMYIKDVANPDLVDKVKSRISEIDANVNNLSMLEQHIEERPYSIIPSVLWTELPDRACAFLQEGNVVLVNNSPGCLVVPVTFWSFFHTSEDQYERWSYGNLVRIVRFISLLAALLVPALYIAITNYHAEMIPTDLALAIAGTREVVPFPAIMEVLIMEVSFEILREAGLRIPSAIGATIGIVGALILGQAAVEANIVSPILVIVVAITGLASFTVPNVSLNFAVRLGRFFALAFAAVFGLIGVGFFVTLALTYLSTLKSFDVPFFAPSMPHYRSSGDTILRPPVWQQWLRPFHLYPKQEQRKENPKGGK